MRQVDPDVVPVYPITPQTPIIQTFAKLVADGQASTEILNDAAVETCFRPLYEVVEGRYRLTYEPRRLPVEEWLGSQQRFAHLFRPGSEGLIRQIQDQVDSEWDALLARCDGGSDFRGPSESRTPTEIAD
jgi:hypothetical protein